MLPDTLIVLPTIASNIERTRAAVAALEAHTEPRCDTLLIIDEVTDAAPATVLGRPVLFDLSPTRRGLVHAYRAGFARFAQGPWARLILMEDGVLVTPGWDVALRRALDLNPWFGWVACGQQENANAPFTSLCSMMTREAALATDGGPAEAYAPEHFDDADMLFRLLTAGYRPHGVDHLVSQPEGRTSRVGTFEEDVGRLMEKRAVFAERWGVSDMAWAMVPVYRGDGACSAGKS